MALDVATIYNGESRWPANLQVGEWGNAQGDAQILSPTPLEVKTGVYGIAVSTLGRYQGTRFDFNPPLDTHLIFGVKNVYLELYLRPSLNTVNKHGFMPNLTNLRFTLFTANGIGTCAVPASQFYPAEVIQKTWVKIDLPLSKLDPALHLSGPLSRIVITSDGPVSFLLGRLAVVQDTSALRADITTFPAILETDQTIFFSASVDSGLSPCTAAWDFDTTTGATVDAMGNQVTCRYTNPGTYLITCTVRDANGIKDPITVTKEIKINRSTH